MPAEAAKSTGRLNARMSTPPRKGPMDMATFENIP